VNGGLYFISTRKRMNKKEGQNKSGFTLLEILVAVFILSIVVSTIYAAYSGTFSIVERTTREAEVYAMARIAMERIVEDLESIYTPKNKTEEDNSKSYYGFITTEGDVGDKIFDNLVFTSMAHLSFHEGPEEATIAKISYYIKEGDNNEVFALCRSDQPDPDSDLESEISEGPVLCEGLTNVEFTYYDAKETSYDHWDSRSEEFGYIVPAMVRVRLSFLNPSDQEAPYLFTTGVAIPAGIGRQE
jgi:general secretion pathway protein J